MNHGQILNGIEHMANAATVAGPHVRGNHNPRRTKMQRQITTNISVISAFVVAISGLCAEEALAGGSDCTSGSIVRVCVQWSQVGDPVEGVDYFVTFTDPSNPVVELKTADLAWIVYATLVSNGNPANIGTLALRAPTPAGEDFEVTVANGTGAGAANVGTINLDYGGFTGFSSIKGGSISGDLTSGLTLVQDSSGAGGELTFTIDGDVSGAVNVPVLKTLFISGALSANIDVTTAMDGDRLTVDGEVVSGVHITVEDMVNNSQMWFLPAPGFAADITLKNGVPSGSGVAIHAVFTTHVTFDFNNADLGGFFTSKLDTDADFVNGGAITGILHQGRAGSCSHFIGSMAFTSVSTTGKINLNPCVDLDGTISITGAMDGDVTVDGDVLATRLISIGSDQSGDISVTGAVLGSIDVNGNHTGVIDITGRLDGTGKITVDGSVSGDVDIGGDLSGDVSLGSDTKGDVHVGGDLTGSVTVAGLLGGRGRIMVDGSCDGAIGIGEKTEPLSLIHCLGGLGLGSTIEVNTTEGNFNAGGTIHVGPVFFIGPPPPPITFDGCIRIYDEVGTGNGGDLTGRITVVGCHATPHDLNICIDGNDNGNVTIEQTECTNQVVWSCPPGGCP